MREAAAAPSPRRHMRAAARFRQTDPLMTGRTRRALAAPSASRTPAAASPRPAGCGRWPSRGSSRPTFVSELLTRAVGLLELARPKAVACDPGRLGRRDRHRAGAGTPQGRVRRRGDHADRLAVPYLDLEYGPARPTIQPDFAIVCPREDGEQTVGSWLIMGDAKDYERMRARIDDGRMLKGFLQVALGAESAAAWSKLPDGMGVHRYGALAVPRNAFLRPEAIVEHLDDHRREVRARAEERLEALAELGDEPAADEELPTYVAHLTATFDPRTCASCSLFAYCRGELRALGRPGAAPDRDRSRSRGAAGRRSGWWTAPASLGSAPATVVAQRARHRQRAAPVDRTPPRRPGRAAGHDQRGPGEVRLGGAGRARHRRPAARRVGRRSLAVASSSAPTPPRRGTRSWGSLGAAIRRCSRLATGPVHLVVPDKPTADLLVSMADSLAGVELSRLRWQRDLDEGRQPSPSTARRRRSPSRSRPTPGSR